MMYKCQDLYHKFYVCFPIIHNETQEGGAERVMFSSHSLFLLKWQWVLSNAS